MKSFWVSWYANAGEWELHSPWWISGYRMMHDPKTDEEWDEPTVCAAVRAESEDAAKEIILASHDKRPADLEWRFCEERPDDWTPFNDRFPRSDWMRWAA